MGSAPIRIPGQFTPFTVFPPRGMHGASHAYPCYRPIYLFSGFSFPADAPNRKMRIFVENARGMDEILKIDTVDAYNRLFGFETRHPQVGVVRFDTVASQGRYRMTLGLYALFLKETKGCRIDYGKTSYDFDDDTIVCMAPGQTAGYTDIEGAPKRALGLLFHPDFIRGTALGQKIRRYTFFSYETHEALHLSAEERAIVRDCLDKIRRELEHPIDRHTKGLVATTIELLLDYCLRFYERQFVTRQELNLDVLARFERLLDDYLSSGDAEREGLPSVRYFAEKVFLSPNYFGDLVKRETGKSAQEYIQLKMIDAAKEGLLDAGKSIGQVAAELGFQYPQHFVRFFKRQAGCTPREYRLRHS